MSKHLNDLPIQKRLLELQVARQRLAILEAFYTCVMDLEKTDKLIETLPDGVMKDEKRAMQEQAWAIVLSEDMCGLIMIRE